MVYGNYFAVRNGLFKCYFCMFRAKWSHLPFVWIQWDFWLRSMRFNLIGFIFFLFGHFISVPKCVLSHLWYSQCNSGHNSYFCWICVQYSLQTTKRPWVAICIRFASDRIRYWTEVHSPKTMCDQWVLLLFSLKRNERSDLWCARMGCCCCCPQLRINGGMYEYSVHNAISRMMLPIPIDADRNEVQKNEMKQNWRCFNTGCNLLDDTTKMYACPAKLSFLNYIWMTEKIRKRERKVKNEKKVRQEEVCSLHVPIFNWRCSWTHVSRWKKDSQKSYDERKKTFYFVYAWFFLFSIGSKGKNDRQNNGSSNSNIVPTNKIDDCRKNQFESNRSLTDACNVIKSRGEDKKHRMVNTILKAKTVISVKWHASAKTSQAKRMRASQLSTYLFQIID